MKFKTPIDHFLAQKEPPSRSCDVKGCPHGGEYRAPKSRNLNEYYWFCLEHVQNYNKEWNYYAGMSFEEAEQSRLFDIHGQRPTWPFGQRTVHGPINFSIKDFVQGQERFYPGPPEDFTFAPKPLSKSQRHAMSLLELEWPFGAEDLKKAYKKMAKKYHPDLHGNDKIAEEKFKSITNAHQTLVQFFEGKF